MSSALKQYFQYVKTQSADAKDWGLIQDFSGKEVVVRNTYLRNDTSAVPFRGTGVQRIADDTELQQAQADLTQLVNTYYLSERVYCIENALSFFKEALRIRESLI